MWPIFVALEYLGGMTAVAVIDDPEFVMIGLFFVDLIAKAFRNASIEKQLGLLQQQHAAAFGRYYNPSDLSETSRMAGFATGGTVGGAAGMLLGAAASAFMNGRAENQMSEAQRQLVAEIKRVTATTSNYSLTFALMSWLAIVWGARWFIVTAWPK